MPLYLYRGFHEDNHVDANMWASALEFRIRLIKKTNPESLIDDPSNGLGNADMMTAQEFFSRLHVNEVTVGEVNNYAPAAIPQADRSVTWDITNDLQRFNAANPIVWPNLATGADIGAYCIIRGAEANDANNRVWMADSSATNLPAPTNGQDFSITLNTLGWLIGRQPLFGT